MGSYSDIYGLSKWALIVLIVHWCLATLQGFQSPITGSRPYRFHATTTLVPTSQPFHYFIPSGQSVTRKVHYNVGGVQSSLFVAPTPTMAGRRRAKMLSSQRLSSSLAESDPGKNEEQPIGPIIRQYALFFFKATFVPLKIAWWLLASTYRRIKKTLTSSPPSSAPKTIVINGDRNATFNPPQPPTKEKEKVGAVSSIKTISKASVATDQVTTESTVPSSPVVEPVVPPLSASPPITSASLFKEKQKEWGELMGRLPSEGIAVMASKVLPIGSRWATAMVDLSGEWTLSASDQFKEEYDEYLKRLGQPLWFRTIALKLVSVTTEETLQSDEGRELFIRSTNTINIWERTLVTSGAGSGSDEFSPELVPVVTADKEEVNAEAWWEEDGSVHRSWLRGVRRYGGGSFESKRYLEDNGKVLVCESVFHFDEKEKEDARVTWRFLRK